MESYGKLLKRAGTVLLLVASLGWWWWQGVAPSRRTATQGAPATAVTEPAADRIMVPGTPAAGTANAEVTVPDPGLTWAIPVSARWLVTETAAQFVRSLLSVPPGSPFAAARCATLVTPSFEATLGVAPGAPALAGAAQPVVVIAVAATIDNWAAGEAGVALGVSVRAGPDGSPALLPIDVQVVLVAGRWLVDGMEL